MRRFALCLMLCLVSTVAAGDVFIAPSSIVGPTQVAACSGLVKLSATRAENATASGWTITAPRLEFITAADGQRTGIAFAAPSVPCLVHVSFVEVVDNLIVFHQHDVKVVRGGGPPPQPPPVTPPADPPPGDRLTQVREAVAKAVRAVDPAYRVAGPKIVANLVAVASWIQEGKIKTASDAVTELCLKNRLAYRNFAERQAWDTVFGVIDKSLRAAGYEVFHTADEIVAPLKTVARGIQQGSQ